MAQVEQAIFTSAETDRSAGYQVVSKSDGVCEADARQLAVWGPSHESLLELGPDAVSVNFHPLPSGAYCVSRTAPAGWEYSGRGGYRVYTHCLIVPPEVLGRFANNPFALVRAAQAGGALEVYDRIPSRLEPLLLVGRATPVDQTLLARLVADPGPGQMAVLVQTALDSASLAVSGTPPAASLIAGLLNCLPVECRTEFSFSTGLKFSSRRPFRIVAFSGIQTERKWVAHQNGVTVLELSADTANESVHIDGWARLIEQVLASGRTSFLASQLSKRRFQLSVEDLPALGLQFFEDLDTVALRKDHVQDVDDRGPVHPVRRRSEEQLEEESRNSTFGPHDEISSDLQRAHAAHRRFKKDSPTTTQPNVKAAAPSKMLEPDSPKVLEKLEHLDDVVYEAMAGQTTAMEELAALWLEVLGELGESLVAESREQYLRYALMIWEESVDSGCIRNPARAVQAIEVICLLFGDAGDGSTARP